MAVAVLQQPREDCAAEAPEVAQVVVAETLDARLGAALPVSKTGVGRDRNRGQGRVAQPPEVRACSRTIKRITSASFFAFS